MKTSVPKARSTILLPLHHLPFSVRALISLFPTALVLAVRELLPPLLNQTPAAVHYPLVILATWIGGLVPGLVSTVACSAYTLFVLRPYLLSAPFSDPPALVRSSMFFVSAIMFVVLISGLQRALVAANRAIHARDEFLKIASHELKTPLTSLMLQKQIRRLELERDQTPSISREQATMEIDLELRNIEKIDRLITDMLDVSRLENKLITLHKETFDLRELLEEQTSRSSSLAQAMGVELRTKIDPAPLVGIWDRMRLEQVYANLLSNAIRYGQKAPVVVEAFKDQGSAVIKMSDQGIGIEPKDKRRIFEKYERAVSADEASGLGLGLHISREIVLAHGGTIDVESEPGSGSTFIVRLPLQNEG